MENYENLNKNEQMESILWFIRNQWLFDLEWENTQLAKEGMKMGDLCLYFEEPKVMMLKGIEQSLMELDIKELEIVLEWLKHQMMSMGLVKANGVIPYFINILGENIANIIQWKERNKKQG